MIFVALRRLQLIAGGGWGIARVIEELQKLFTPYRAATLGDEIGEARLRHLARYRHDDELINRDSLALRRVFEFAVQ